ncbi:glycosyltransferase family 2 protein [Catenibacterium mitsuokai]|uniref:glycosyltransferase family 2 protein n=1 Tax=Catenibacterium mitsuokai TaxID=100886 RepID=UPI0003153899|nr:glycosyltransferase family 2 protein [Catenibacterium mitsuokai]UWO54336.1 glycosyltransferase family 2 protein [Catenibacterium mitsuokai]
MCRISIIMPVYNKELYIRESINSVINQSFKDWELIVVNDGSTDNSLSIASSFQDSRIKVFSTKNSGVSCARNFGIDHHNGEYITFFDADDILDEHYLEALYDPTADMVLGGLTKIDYKGNIIERVKSPYLGFIRIDKLAEAFYRDQSKTGIYGYVSTKIIKSRIIKNNNIRFDSSITLAEDFNFFLEVYSNIQSIKFIDYCGYYYKQKTINSGINVDDKKIDFFKQMQIQNKVKQFLIKCNSFNKENELIFERIMSHYVYTIIINNWNIGYFEFRKKMIALYKIKSKAVINMSFLPSLTLRIYNCHFIGMLYLYSKLHSCMR